MDIKQLLNKRQGSIPSLFLGLFFLVTTFFVGEYKIIWVAFGLFFVIYAAWNLFRYDYSRPSSLNNSTISNSVIQVKALNAGYKTVPLILGTLILPIGLLLIIFHISTPQCLIGLLFCCIFLLFLFGYIHEKNQVITISPSNGTVTISVFNKSNTLSLGKFLKIRMCIGYKGQFQAYIVGTKNEFLLAYANTASGLNSKIYNISQQLGLPIEDDMG